MPKCCDDCATNETPYTQGFRAGVAYEIGRIVRLLTPLAEHDESCYDEGEVNCYSEDCAAGTYQHVLELIGKKEEKND